ncbi:hypothetical protein D9611_011957 [Ephemerocybe angulata]|uniref:N-acetyltransferase domain-containing protein n=1 Tax=Ephemerocybe angulata TaxID=980116 RepID=A0A8H5C415_9AGAR|nr:hypothetical protein D9611_011957 [Tulosesus angulatus]
MSAAPLNFKVKHLNPPTENEIDRIVDLFKAAFNGDQFGAVLSHGEGLNELQLRACVGAASIGGTIHVAVLPHEEGKEDEIVGAAVWFAPGQVINSTAEQRAAGWDQFLQAGSEGLRKWWNDYFIPLITKHAADPTVFGGPSIYPTKTWYLHLFATLAAYQKRGIARALIAHAEALAKESGAMLVLETATEVDVMIYERMGFEVRRKVEVHSPVGDARLWFMRKETA